MRIYTIVPCRTWFGQGLQGQCTLLLHVKNNAVNGIGWACITRLIIGCRVARVCFVCDGIIGPDYRCTDRCV